MELRLIQDATGGRLVIAGRLTRLASARLEAGVIEAMRRYPRVDVDLSGVQEIDPWGIRLIRLMQNLGGKDVSIVAASPPVQRAA